MHGFGKSRAEQRLQTNALASLRRRPHSVEARVLGESLVATSNAHVQRYPAMSWAEVRAVLRVLEHAAAAETERESVQG